jgi:Na+/H+ antiporter NhaC
MGGDDLELITLLAANPLSFEGFRIAFGESDASVVLFQAALVAAITAMVIGISKKIFSVKEALETFLLGIKSMNITAVILLLAWAIASSIKELGTAVYLVDHLSTAIPAWSLPALIFLIGSVISFATGTSFGTMGIMMPLAIPLAWAIDPTHSYLVLSVGAVLTGAIFGDHCSPISDTSILSAMGAACDLMDHVNTQMPYAIVIAVVSTFMYILAGLGINVFVTLLIGVAIVTAIVRFVGKPVPAA